MLSIGTFGPTAVLTPSSDRYTASAPKPEAANPLTIEDRVELTSSRVKEIESTLGERVPNQVLVKVAPDLSSDQLKALAADFGATLKQEISIPDVMAEAFDGKLLLLEAGPGLTEVQTMAMMEGDERVKTVASNDRMEMIEGVSSPLLDGAESLESVLRGPGKGASTPAEPGEKLPNDLHFDQWNMRNRNYPGGRDGSDIQAGYAWGVTTGQREGGPIVAIVDSGIDVFHEDIKDNMWVNPNEIKDGKDNDFDGFTDDIHGIDGSDGSGNIFDEVGHGTHVAGVIGAVGNNEKGVAGVNWETRMMGVKIADNQRVNLLAAITGILYAAEHGARIANHSWGGRIDNPILKDVMSSSPTLHVCAAGNGQRDADVVPSYPAAYDLPNVISVAASARKDDHLFLSNWGKETVDVHAPGALIRSTTPQNNYEDMSGTSMAAPHVSGVAALIATKFPDISNRELKDRIIYSADKKEELRDKSVSGGRLNAFKALEDDQLAPSAVSDFRLTDVTADGFEVAWTGVGDDGMEGLVSAYDIWADYGDEKARLVPEFPKGPGAKEKALFRTQPKDFERPLKVTMTPVDNVGNRAKASHLTSVLPAAAVPFADDFDGETSAWTTEAKWGRVEVEGRGLVYTDTPDGEYKDSTDNGIVSPSFDLSTMRSAVLSFDAQMKAEKWDFLWVEASSDGGDEFELIKVVRPSEIDREWNSYKFDISEFDGQEDVRLKFRFRTSNKGVDDGVYVDKVKVESAVVKE